LVEVTPRLIDAVAAAIALNAPHNAFHVVLETKGKRETHEKQNNEERNMSERVRMGRKGVGDRAVGWQKVHVLKESKRDVVNQVLIEVPKSG
jgi:hypothetical protein